MNSSFPRLCGKNLRAHFQELHFAHAVFVDNDFSLELFGQIDEDLFFLNLLFVFFGIESA